MFLEKGVFDQAQTKYNTGPQPLPRDLILMMLMMCARTNHRRILEAGKEAGLLLNFHGDEINYMNAGELGGELGALSISHLERVRTFARSPLLAMVGGGGITINALRCSFITVLWNAGE